MATPRSANEAVDMIDADFSRRKRELTSMWMFVDGASAKEQGLRCRAAICLLYSHWEGFVKSATETYLQYVARVVGDCSELRAPLVAMVIASRIRRFSSEAELGALTRTVRELTGETSGTLPTAELLRSNLGGTLDSLRFRERLALVGADLRVYESRFHFLDSRVLRSRHEIAHGSLAPIAKEDYLDFHQTILELLEAFRTDVQNCIVNRAYRR